MSDQKKKLSKHGRDKVLALLKSLATDCDDTDEHRWTQCRHCLASFELKGSSRARQRLRAFIAETQQGSNDGRE